VELASILIRLVSLVEPANEVGALAEPRLLLEVVEAHQPVQRRVRVPLGRRDAKALLAEFRADLLERVPVILVERFDHGFDAEHLVHAFRKSSAGGVESGERGRDGSMRLPLAEREASQDRPPRCDVIRTALVRRDQIPDILSGRVEHRDERPLFGPLSRFV